MGRPDRCDCRCGNDSSNSSESSASSETSSGSSISSDSSWSSSHGSGGCFDCCPALPLEWSLWWPGPTDIPARTPGWMYACDPGSVAYSLPPRGTYRLRFLPDRCYWMWDHGLESPGCWAWKLSQACVRDLIEPPTGVDPATVRIRLESLVGCAGPWPGVNFLTGVWQTYLPPLSCGQLTTLALNTPVQSFACRSTAPPHNLYATYSTPLTLNVWPS